MSFGNYNNQAILNALFGKTSNWGALASAPAIYVGVSSTTPAEDGTNVTEPSAGAYARVLVLAAGWNAATLADPSVVTNNGVITFPTATANWLALANLTHFVLYDAITAGNYMGMGLLDTAKPVADGDTLSFADTALTVSLD